MLNKFFFHSGVTMIETIVVIFIIIVLTSIVIANFPQVQKDLALSRAAYVLAQDFKKVENDALSGQSVTDSLGNLIQIKGYGIFIDTSDAPVHQYIVYADVNDNGVYDPLSAGYCAQETNPQNDCILYIGDLSTEDSNVYIKKIGNIYGTQTSINAASPNSTITISNLLQGYSSVEIVIGLTSNASLEKTVSINSAGLIEVN